MRLTEANQEFFFGHQIGCQVGYAADAEVRTRSASGGLISAALIHLLETGQVQGVLICRLGVKDGSLKARPFIAVNREEVLASAGSIYLEVNPLSDLGMVRAFEGRLAMVGLPCHLETLDKLARREPGIRDKISHTIGLFCGHNSRRELIHRVLAKRGVDLDEVESFRFRRGLWRGRTWVHKKDGTAENFPFQAFSRYQNLHFFSLRRCLGCADHTAEKADLSVGDLWSQRFKGKSIKHSAVIIRTKAGSNLVKGMADAGKVRMEPCTLGEVFNAQRRSLVCHKNLYARSRLAPIFKLNIPPAPKTPTRPNDWLASLIVLSNAKWSYSPRYKDLIFKLPKQILQAYLLFFKGLTHI